MTSLNEVQNSVCRKLNYMCMCIYTHTYVYVYKCMNKYVSVSRTGLEGSMARDDRCLIWKQG